uniref:Aminoglycoside phosphotransferase domain-containing protein n=1 Tax=Mycena chlorophos TaxID=658473 RepID=A0ABQ0LPU5_MYCCL|nr:predicted protein [Mycena chlorophos]
MTASGLSAEEEAELAFLVQYDATLSSVANWLRETLEDELRGPYLRAVRAEVNLDGLQKYAEQFMGRNVTGVHFFGGGLFNIIFLVTFGDGTDILARLRIPVLEFLPFRNPFSVVPNVAASLESEMATYRFLERETTIPVPHVHGGFTNPDIAGMPLMLIERARGIMIPDLAECPPQYLQAIAAQLARFENELCKVSFPAVGCLTDDATVGPLVEELSLPIIPADHGPFATSRDFVFAYIDDLQGQLDRVNEWQQRRELFDPEEIWTRNMLPNGFLCFVRRSRRFQPRSTSRIDSD